MTSAGAAHLLKELAAARDAELRANARTPPIHLLAAAGWQQDERTHCQLLRWLLDPHGSHGQGEAFLRPLLVELGGEPGDLSDAAVTTEVQRDGTRIDVEIVVERRILVHIEAKIDACDGCEQPEREAKLLQHRARERGVPKAGAVGVYLTRDGERAGGFIPKSWLALGDILEVGLDGCARNAATLLRHIINCFKSLTTRDYSMGASTSKIDGLILKRWTEVEKLLADVDRLEGAIRAGFSEDAFRRALRAEGLPSNWELDLSKREGAVLYAYMRPPGFHQKGNSWTCLSAEGIELRSLLASDPDARPWIGIDWGTLRRARSARALRALKVEVEELAARHIGGRRKLGPPTGDHLVWWTLGRVAPERGRFVNVPRHVVREWKLLWPLLPAISRASRLRT